MNLQLAYLDKLNEGKEIGKELGKEIAKTEYAKRMLSANKLSLEDISYYTELPIEYLKELQNELNN